MLSFKMAALDTFLKVKNTIFANQNAQHFIYFR